jgi:hypothetical protein
MKVARNWRVAYEGDEAFVIVDDVKVAKRGKPGTPGANTWVSLEPGWTVSEIKGTYGTVELRYNGERVI